MKPPGGTSTHFPLLQQLQQTPANHEAWTQFTALYGPLIRGWIRQRGVTDTDLEDIYQDILVKLVEKLPGFADDNRRGRFRGWLLIVTRNQAHERRRSNALKEK
jgi:RNA polymerase sigma-70 factor (ECF subfamily)